MGLHAVNRALDDAGVAWKDIECAFGGREVGMMVSTQFFAMKIQRYMHDYAITEDSLVQVAVKNFKNGSLSENAWRRTPFDYETVAASDMLNDPLRKYMFCAPCEDGAGVVCRGDLAPRFTKKPIWVKGLTVRTSASRHAIPRYGCCQVYGAPGLSAVVILAR